MDIFDNFLDSAKNLADVTAKKSGEIVEVSKLKLECVQINADIKKCYEKLGIATYSMVKSNYENPELVNSIVSEIDASMANLEENASKISVIKKLTVCSCCGHKNPLDFVYCSKCGNKITTENEQPPEQEKTTTEAEDTTATADATETEEAQDV